MMRPVRKRLARDVNLPAPVRGLMEYTPVTKPDPLGAEVVENWLPTSRGLRVRGGYTRAAFVTDAVKTIFSLREAANPALFAATSNAIYDITSQNPTTAPAPEVSQMTSGDWSTQQIGLSGDNFLVAVNGADTAQVYQAGWNPLAGEAVNALQYDAGSGFLIGETVTGGTSGATATILGLAETTGTTGTLKIGAVTGGPFQDNEALTSASGSATANGAETSASTAAITGVDTSSLSHVWLYRSRLLFVEKDSLTAWYLPVSQVGGAAQDISLAGVFRRGGSLLMGATWSLDTGDGIDDKCVFISDQGEVAIYRGSNPSDANDWALEGRYDIGKPLGKRATMQAGGDLLVATDDGIVPISQAITKDPAALSLAAVTRNIQRTWGRQTEAFGQNAELIKWTSNNLMCVVLPGGQDMLTANLETGAWAPQSGWYADCADEYFNDVFIGRADGRVYKLDSSGADDGAPFVARLAYGFQDLGRPQDYKTASMMRGSFFTSGNLKPKYSASCDYTVSFPSPPATSENPTTAMVWDVDNWDEAVWGGAPGDPSVGKVTQWQSVSCAGYAISPCVQVTSSGSEKLDVELLGVDLIFEQGGRAA